MVRRSAPPRLDAAESALAGRQVDPGGVGVVVGRSREVVGGGGTRTRDLVLPKHVRYQATLLPACLNVNIA